MSENENERAEISCIFCNKDLERSEMVRYRGAISCRECAEKQKPILKIRTTPLFYIAGIGCLIGLLNFVYFTIHGYIFTQIFQTSYIQPLNVFFIGMVLTFLLISIGLYEINRVHLHIAGIVGIVVGLFATIMSAISLIDFVTNGPYYLLETGTYIKTLNYYPAALSSYSLFAITAALAILLHMTNTKTENVSLVSAASLMIISVVMISAWTWFFVGFIHAFAYAVTFAFFVTRITLYEEEPIQPV